MSEVMQDSNTSHMIHGVASLIAFLSQDTTLLPGTVIPTGAFRRGFRPESTDFLKRRGYC